METTELQKRLERLDENKLMDVVRNYRQYGYSDDTREYAIELLQQRGVSIADLQLTGNFENKSYDHANDVLASFMRNSKLAFLLYGILVALKIIDIWFRPATSTGSMTLIVSFYVVLFLYLFFLLQSFIQQSRFYKLTGDEYGSDGALVYVLLGMPFYIVMYFVFQGQMKERMKMVR